jgi:protein-S-isoprenylcysteine O-methyltransferase Ste14
MCDGFNKYTRNPNYLGEIMLYSSFAYLVNTPGTWFIMSYMWGIVFVIRMTMKDYSLSKKAGWPEYKATSWLLLPKFYGNTMVALSIYGVFALVAYKVYDTLP